MHNTNPETPTTIEEFRALEFRDCGFGEGDDDCDFEDCDNEDNEDEGE